MTPTLLEPANRRLVTKPNDEIFMTQELSIQIRSWVVIRRGLAVAEGNTAYVRRNDEPDGHSLANGRLQEVCDADAEANFVVPVTLRLGQELVDRPLAIDDRAAGRAVTMSSWAAALTWNGHRRPCTGEFYPLTLSTTIAAFLAVNFRSRMTPPSAALRQIYVKLGQPTDGKVVACWHGLVF